MKSKKIQEIAQSWNLWCEYVDTNATMTREDFDAMSIQDRVEFIRICFGDDQEEMENVYGMSSDQFDSTLE